MNILSVAYRGYSSSEGKPDQAGILLDAEAILEYAKTEPRINNERVFLIGRSLGGATAVHTAAKLAKDKDEWYCGVILENTFSSISKVADALFPFLKLIPNIKNRMLRLDWSSENCIGEIKKPILFVCGTIDKLCPMAMTNELHEAAVGSKNKEMFAVPNGDHNNTFMQAGPDYFVRLRRFMNNCIGDG